MSIGATSRLRNEVIAVFEGLGGQLAASWSRARYSREAFPEIAANALERRPLHEQLSYETLLRWIASTDTLPPQPNLSSGFGDSALTLFWHPSFYIEALFWCTSTTSIHGHGFAGAFQLLTGSSLQSCYEFAEDLPRTTGASRCRLGRLTQTSAHVLRQGSTQRILSGEAFIHSAFHLGYPSVTIVVRTFATEDRAQYNYHPPGVAMPSEPAFDQLTRRLLQVARLQATLQSRDLRVTTERVAEIGDLAAAYTLLRDITPILNRQGRTGEIAELILRLAKAHGLSAVTRIAQAITNDELLRPLTRARETVVDEELRLCIALLLTQQSRSFLLSQVAELTGDAEPGDRLAAWICALAKQGILNVPHGDAVLALLSRLLGSQSTQAATEPEPGDAARVLAQIRAERLLAPLFAETTS